MENNACDNNRIAKGLDKNKVFVKFYQNLSNETTEKGAGNHTRRLSFMVSAAKKTVRLLFSRADYKKC